MVRRDMQTLCENSTPFHHLKETIFLLQFIFSSFLHYNYSWIFSFLQLLFDESQMDSQLANHWRDCKYFTKGSFEFPSSANIDRAVENSLSFVGKGPHTITNDHFTCYMHIQYVHVYPIHGYKSNEKHSTLPNVSVSQRMYSNRAIP